MRAYTSVNALSSSTGRPLRPDCATAGRYTAADTPITTPSARTPSCRNLPRMLWSSIVDGQKIPPTPSRHRLSVPLRTARRAVVRVGPILITAHVGGAIIWNRRHAHLDGGARVVRQRDAYIAAVVAVD